MQADEIKDLFEKSKQDGAKLYSVADALHKIAITIIALLALAGVVSTFAMIQAAGFFAGVLVLAATGALCLLLYAFDIIAINAAKVLVHILFSNLAKLDQSSTVSVVSGATAGSTSKTQLNSEELKIKDQCIEYLVKSGYVLSSEEITAQGFVWKIRGKSGAEFACIGLDELKKFADIYKDS